MRKAIAIAAASATVVVIAGVSWFGVKQYQSRIDCQRRRAVLARQIESIKRDAHERLKIGTKSDEISRFFADHDIPFTFVDSKAIGTLQTSGCAPLGCGTDEAIIGVRVNLDETGAVRAEPIVVDLYTNCL